MRKRALRVFLLICTVSILIRASSYALDYVPYIAMQIDNPNISVNGNVAPIDDKNTAPVLREGSAMLPITALVDAINRLTEWNLSVRWDADEKKVTLMSEHPVAELWIDKTTAVIEGAEIELAAAPMIVNGRAMVPLRVISESLGLYVEWRGDNRGILISFSSSGFPVNIVFPGASGTAVDTGGDKNTSRFKPVQHKEELYGTWGFTDGERRYAMRFEERYLISVYEYGIEKGPRYGPGYQLENGRLRYASALISLVDNRSEFDFDRILETARPDNIWYNDNDFLRSGVEWQADISHDGNSLRLSREIPRNQLSYPGEYKTIIHIYERTS